MTDDELLHGARGAATPTGFQDPRDDWLRFQANRNDMRIQVVRRAINRGALSGMSSEITDFAAWCVLDALDAYDRFTAEQEET